MYITDNADINITKSYEGLFIIETVCKLLIQMFSDKEIRDILDESFIDDTVDIIEEMPANVVSRILKNSTTGERKAINEILRYPKDSAGSIMTIEYVSLSIPQASFASISSIVRIPPPVCTGTLTLSHISLIFAAFTP